MCVCMQYYFGNCFMLLLHGFSAVVLLILVGEWEDFDVWAWIVLIVGSMAFALMIYVTVGREPSS